MLLMLITGIVQATVLIVRADNTGNAQSAVDAHDM